MLAHLLIEPTESGAKNKIDRFISAMKVIRAEIAKIEAGMWPADDNPHVNAPHTSHMLTADKSTHPCSRQKAAFPGETKSMAKYWPPVARIDNAYGERNLVCTCPQLSDYEVAAEWSCDIPESATYLTADMSQTISFTSLL